ncbi:response regulator transcription factor [Alteromonas sp. P256]|uniref:response regulator transcription factor n=1 Tax=Alteromonas sp. P256 TaxID=3117399 RepID=UPI002FE3E103
MTHILVVEDEVSIALAVKAFLEKEQMACTVLHTAADLLEIVLHYKPDLIVLDLMLPGGDGIDLCQNIRKHSQVPIIMLTARSSERDRLIGLQAGADDYVCKPFSAPELVLRIKAVLRRSDSKGDYKDDGQAVHCAEMKLNRDTLEAEVRGKKVLLTPVEFALAKTLLTSPNKIFSRDALMDVIYSDERIVSDRTVDSHVSKLRRKLKIISPDNELVIAIYGAGYKYTPHQ